MKDVRISYNENWQKIHWQSFTSAYRRSPFFEFYEDTFRIFYEEKHEFLFDYNLLTMKTISSILKIELPVYFTDNYQLKTNDDFSDRRSFFLPGKVYESDFPAYPQVFNDRFEFIGDLCVLDVIFNLGKKSTEYLMGIKF